MIGELYIRGALALQKLLNLDVGKIGTEKRSPHRVSLAVHFSWVALHSIPHRQRAAQSATGISGGRLYPYTLERSFTENAAISHAVQCDASGHAQAIHSRFAVNRPG